MEQAKTCAVKRKQKRRCAQARSSDEDGNAAHACRGNSRGGGLPGGLGRAFLLSDFNYDSKIVCAIVIKEFGGGCFYLKTGELTPIQSVH